MSRRQPKRGKLEFLTTADVAERIRVKPKSVTDALYRARLTRDAGVHSILAIPEPIAYAGHMPLWEPAAIEEWISNRTSRNLPDMLDDDESGE